MTAKDCTLQNYFDWRNKPFLYFLRRIEDGLIKIGWSQNIIQRLDALYQEHGPLEILAIVPGGPVVEKAWHDWYKDLKEQGEWFRPEEDLMMWFDERKDMLLADHWPDEPHLSLPSSSQQDWQPKLIELGEDEFKGN